MDAMPVSSIQGTKEPPASSSSLDVLSVLGSAQSLSSDQLLADDVMRFLLCCESRGRGGAVKKTTLYHQQEIISTHCVIKH